METAAWILKEQMNGKLGSWITPGQDQFPHIALAKTCTKNKHVPDSAGTAPAYLCGIKTTYKTTGVSGAA